VTPRKRYIVTLGADETLEVELLYSPEDGCWWADVEGERLALNLDHVEPGGAVHAKVDGEGVDLRIYERADGFRLGLEGGGEADALAVRARSEGEILLSAPRPGPAQGPAPHPAVRCPITGEVLEVLAAAGDRVAEGQPLLLVEAMKMETTVRSPRAGAVTAVLVVTGDRVRAGDAVVELAVAAGAP
jgi:biotin carboxyl carrier protein